MTIRQAVAQAQGVPVEEVDAREVRTAISEATGFDQGDEFTGEAQVREYFTADAQREMFGADAITDPEVLAVFAEAVIDGGWHMAGGGPARDEMLAHEGMLLGDY